MTDLVALLLGVVVGFLILRHPLMRSARSAGVVILCTGLALLAARAGSPLGAAAATGLGLLPLLVAFRFPRLITALEAADFAEHEMIERVRRSLRTDGPDTSERERQAIESLTQSEPPALGWLEVRRALLDQIEISAGHRMGTRDVTLADARESRQRIDTAWWAAIEARRRFVR